MGPHRNQTKNHCGRANAPLLHTTNIISSSHITHTHGGGCALCYVRVCEHFRYIIENSKKLIKNLLTTFCWLWKHLKPLKGIYIYVWRRNSFVAHALLRVLCWMKLHAAHSDENFHSSNHSIRSLSSNSIYNLLSAKPLRTTIGCRLTIRFDIRRLDGLVGWSVETVNGWLDEYVYYMWTEATSIESTRTHIHRKSVCIGSHIYMMIYVGVTYI